MALKDKQKSKRISNWIRAEIISEILLKLPVESLLRCTSVCKEWYSLISDQSFIKIHYALSSTKINYEHNRLIYDSYKHGNDFISFPLYDVLFDESSNNAIQLENPLQRTRLSRALSIVGACNGLLCILVKDDSTLFIHDPSTRTTNILPKQGARVSYGFGYDEMTHDYKVVKLYLREGYYRTMIYLLKAVCWKEIGLFPCIDPLDDGKVLNRALHWATGDGWSWEIGSLDLENETYGEVLQPEYHKGYNYLGYNYLELGVLGEWLCVLCCYFENSVMDVWVLKVYGVKDSWTKLACIPHQTHNSWDQILYPSCISNDGKVLFQFGLKLLVYDTKDSSSTMIDNFDGCHQACIVVESLVLPFPPLTLADNNKK